MILQAEYHKWVEGIQNEEDGDDNKIIYRNTDEYDDIAKKLENGEDVDLDSLMIPPDTWEKVDA